jgi:hypothetical protein
MQRHRRLADLPIVGYLLGPWSLLSEIRTALLRHGRRITRLEKLMTAMDQKWNEAGRLVGLARAELASLREQLEAEQLDDAAQADAAVTEARSADAARLDALIGALADVVPVTVPDVPTPAPGEPAVDPESGESSDDVLAPGEDGEVNTV